MDHRYFMLHKPRNMVSQFVSSHDVPLLGDIDFDFPEGTHAIGRLDRDSEGLLLLTTDKRITELLFKSVVPHKRSYLVYVKYAVTPQSLALLENGIAIESKGGLPYITQPGTCTLVAHPEDYIADAKSMTEHHAHSWICLTLTEGKFHQVRKMVRAAGHPCVRLIRIAIEDMPLGRLPPGAVQEFSHEEFYKLLNL